MSKELFKLLLNNSFYKKYKDKVSDKLFPDKLISIYTSLEELQDKYNRDITIKELWLKYLADHPTLTASGKLDLRELFDTIRNSEDIGLDIGEEVLTKAWIEELYRDAADKLVAISQGIDIDLTEVENILSKIKSGNILEEKVEYVTTDVFKMLEELDNKYTWIWNLPALQHSLGNSGEGIFGIVSARPDCGKTAFYVSLAYAPNGWLEQGAKVHVIGNEEPAIRTQVRGLSAYTGMTKEELVRNKELAKVQFEKIKDNIYVQDKVNMSIEELDQYVSSHDVDILIIDQLDKLSVRGKYNRSDEKLRALYTAAREIAKKYNVFVIAITQAGAGAAGKMHYGFDDLDGSKTGKAAEADFVLCIGMKDPTDNGGVDDGLRVINIPKNKLTGIKDPVTYYLEGNLSRMRG